MTLGFAVVRENHVSLIGFCHLGLSAEVLTNVYKIGNSSGNPGSHAPKRILNSSTNNRWSSLGLGKSLIIVTNSVLVS